MHLWQDVIVYRRKSLLHFRIKIFHERKIIVRISIVGMPHVLTKVRIKGVDILFLLNPSVQPVNRVSVTEKIQTFGLFSLIVYSSYQIKQDGIQNECTKPTMQLSQTHFLHGNQRLLQDICQQTQT